MTTYEENLILIKDNDFEKLYSKNRGFIIKQALSFKVGEIHKEDLIQCGRIGLHSAIQTYQEDKGYWSSWMTIYIRKEMMSYINSNVRTVRLPESIIYKKDREEFATENMYSLDDTVLDTGEPLYSTISYEESDYKEINTESLKKAILQLKPQWQTIMNMTADGKMLKEIAEHLNITKQAVSTQKASAIKMLQKIMITKNRV